MPSPQDYAKALWDFNSTPGGAAVGNPAYMRQGIKATPWYAEFLKQYGEAPQLGGESNYDYRRAWEGGVRPQPDPYDNNKYHWSSTLPSGQMLKAPNHPTAWKQLYLEATGVNPDAVGATEAQWNAMRLAK